jgi:hypothetical protein
MIIPSLLLSFLFLENMHVGDAYAGPYALRARSQLLLSEASHRGPEAIADTRSERTVPHTATIKAERTRCGCCIRMKRCGEPERRDARGPRQQLPRDCDGCRASVANANARGGHPIAQARETLPVLAFPEPGLDDTAAYQGYQTRFYRDSKQNTVQIYLEPREGRVVHVWADGANESAGFTARDARGRPVRLTWRGEPAQVADSGAVRTIEYRLFTNLPQVELGWFLLGSMRVERDFVYSGRHRQPFTAPPFVVAEESLLVADVGRLPVEERSRHLAMLNASTMDTLRARLQPTLSLARADTAWTVRAQRPSLDGRNRMALEIRVDPRRVKLQVSGRTVSLRTRPGASITFAVKVVTNAAPLSPLSRGEIFNRSFIEFLAGVRAEQDSAGAARAKRMERQVRAVELLSAKEKLMAGLPNFATYFGRDMMMTALMMRPIWSAEMSEHVIASVLRKLGPGGQVSHEEALGGQAIRENAVVYDSLIRGYFRSRRAGRRQESDSLLRRARDILRDLQGTRENYHMIDDEFQLPLLAARYLTDSAVPASRKRSFLSDTSSDGASRLQLLLREMSLVAVVTRPYVESPRATNLVSFPKRDSVHWRSASWRDSDAGYAGGRFAMDVNAIWAPQALEAIATILASLPTIGIGLDSVVASPAGNPLSDYARDPATLPRAIETWKKARQHFEVAIPIEELQRRVRAKLAWLPEDERRYWGKFAALREKAAPLRFLALSLDSAGAPIPVVNTDPATGLFLEDFSGAILSGSSDVLRDISLFTVPYPVGLFVEGLGPLVANDAYAPRAIWERFQKDHYHGPRVVWGREVNLFLMGLANQMAGAFDASGRIKNPNLQPYVHTLDQALRRTLAAVHASGLEHNELWSYRIEGGRLLPVRYGTSSDIQLWNTTNLAVQFVLSQLPALSP